MPTYSVPNISYGASGVTPAGGMDLTGLTTYINQLNRTGQTAANQARLPNEAALETQSSANIGNELAGNVDPSVIRLLQQQGAERGIRVGTDSPNANAAYLQALGLTGYQLQQQGQRDLTAATARNPVAPLFDPATQVMTPYQSGTLGIEQGRLDLAAQAEANRSAEEEARLAQEMALRGAARGGQTATATAAPVTRGATAADLARTYAVDPTQAWWSSIGFNPNTATSPTGGGGTYMGTVAGFDQAQQAAYDQLYGPGAYNTDYGIGELTNPGLTTDNPPVDTTLYDALANLGGGDIGG